MLLNTKASDSSLWLIVQEISAFIEQEGSFLYSIELATEPYHEPKLDFHLHTLLTYGYYVYAEV
jgi:hypothetical protein